MVHVSSTRETRPALEFHSHRSDGGFGAPHTPAADAREVDLGGLGRVAGRLALIIVVVAAVGAFAGNCKGERVVS